MNSRKKIVKRIENKGVTLKTGPRGGTYYKSGVTLKTGPRGGTYYKSDNGNKVYVTSSGLKIH